MRHRTRRPTREWGLTIRMVALLVLIPGLAIALCAAIVVFLPHHLLLGLVIALGIGTVARVVHHVRTKPMAGRSLTEGDDPELSLMVDRLCVIADIARPEIVLSEQRQANSWVIHTPGKQPRLYVTRALRDVLEPEELQAVLAHELTHIVNGDALVMSVVGMPGSIMLNARGGGIDGLLLVAIGAISSIGTAMLSRCREQAADEGAALITGRPSALASALLKVSDAQARIPKKDLRAAVALNAFNLVAVAPRHRWWHDIRPAVRVFATHPRLDARVERLHRIERDQQRSPYRIR